jgi:predicted nucleic acid-binding protein
MRWGDLPEIFKIAAATKFTTYDPAYIYVSKKVSAKLVTAVSELKQKGGSGGDHNP